MIRSNLAELRDLPMARMGLALSTFLAACAPGAPGAAPSTPAANPEPRIAVAEPAPIAAGRAPASGEYEAAPDVLHYDIELALGPNGGEIGARAEIRLRPARGSTRMALDLTGLAVTGVQVDGTEAPFDLADGKIQIALPGPARSEHTVRIDYRGTPDDGLIQQANVHGDATVFADNWPNRARFWFPSVDHPSDKATVRFTVHAPEAWSVIANGAAQGSPVATAAERLRELGFPGPAAHRTWIWESNVAIPAYTMVIGAGPMVRRIHGEAACGRAPASPREDGCVDVGYWVFAPDTASAARSFRRSDQMIDFFTNLVGPFPYEKLMNVQSSTRFGGMENASAIFYSENAIAQGRDIEGTVSHEIAHQWFGDSATEAEWNHLWLSEGFATYFGALFFEHADGVEDFRQRMEQNRMGYIGSPVVDQPVLAPSEDLFALLNANNYPKGGWVLHMLRGLLGDDTFFSGVREYYRLFEGGTAWTEHFQDVMENESAQELDWFFDQWLREPGYPIFSVQWEYDESAGVVRYRIEQVQEEGWPAFRTPLTLAAGEGSSRTEVQVEMEGRLIEGAFPVAADPGTFTIDPDGWVLKDVREVARR